MSNNSEAQKATGNLVKSLSDLLAEQVKDAIRFVVQEVKTATRDVSPHPLAGVVRLVEPRVEVPQVAVFSIQTSSEVPAAVDGVNGTAVASGAPQRPFAAKFVAIAGADVPVADGGAKELLVTKMWVGRDDVRVDMPSGGIQVASLMKLLRDNRNLFDIAYPAISITMNFTNPTAHKARPVQVVFVGEVPPDVQALDEDVRRVRLEQAQRPGYSLSLPVTSIAKGGRVTVEQAPHKPFTPQFLSATSMNVTSSAGGIKELLVTAVYIGCEPVFVNKPSVCSAGVQIGDLSQMLQDLGCNMPSAYPALPISVDLFNPTETDMKDIQIIFSGKTTS